MPALLLLGTAGMYLLIQKKLNIQNGGRVSASTFAFGSAGSVTINASEFVNVSGTSPDPLSPSLVISSANLTNAIIRGGVRLPDLPTGPSGDVAINTKLLRVENGAQITSRNDGPGNAGTVQVNAEDVYLDNNAAITGIANGGEGGLVKLNANGIVYLQDRSNISVSAKGQGTGGNIFINSKFIILQDESFIAANAEDGRGGNIFIKAKGYFISPDRVTATSLRGPQFDGQVKIETVNPEQFDNKVSPPTEQVNPETPNVCSSGSGQSEYTNAGSGGNPPDPREPLVNNPGWSGLSSDSAPTTEITTKRNKKEKRFVYKVNSPQSFPPPALGLIVDKENDRAILTPEPVPGQSVDYSLLPLQKCYQSVYYR